MIAIAWALLLVVLMQFFEYHGWLGGVEGIALDWWVSLSASPSQDTAPPDAHKSPPTDQKTAPIVMVEIDDDFYRNCLTGHSPMPPQLIQEVVTELAGTKEMPHPRVMGIDLLTDAPNETYDALLKFSQASQYTRFVWAAPPARANVVVPGFGDWLGGVEEELVVEAAPVLGKDPAELSRKQADHAPTVEWAVPLYPKDEDLRLRRFARQIYVSNAVGEQPTWPVKLADVYGRSPANPLAGSNSGTTMSQKTAIPFGADVKEVIISYNVTFPEYRLSELMKCDAGITWKTGKAEMYQAAVASDPVVLLGGTFEFGRDSYRTSIGLKSGLLINGFALAAEMLGTKGIGLRDVNRGLLVLADVVVALTIVWIFTWSKPLRAKIKLSLVVLVATMLLALLLTLGLSFAAFQGGYVWVSCIGIALGFPLHLLVDVYDALDHETTAPGKTLPDDGFPTTLVVVSSVTTVVPDPAPPRKTAHDKAGYDKADRRKAGGRKSGRRKKS